MPFIDPGHPRALRLDQLEIRRRGEEFLVAGILVEFVMWTSLAAGPWGEAPWLAVDAFDPRHRCRGVSWDRYPRSRNPLGETPHWAMKGLSPWGYIAGHWQRPAERPARAHGRCGLGGLEEGAGIGHPGRRSDCWSAPIQRGGNHSPAPKCLGRRSSRGRFGRGWGGTSARPRSCSAARLGPSSRAWDRDVSNCGPGAGDFRGGTA